ncbi:probable E3 ubiquitin-protein ligase TRIML2 [Carlito syrichta]|uniref:Probable E3 ubiquitin-protein ligase TRIML2 n=1 Tax=Carlito syrichta TaxID=1868482 RepID=A0A3Q0EHE7_CARSF|nr:probable E3 ubiquitin-protein ligase TRIML2 [Carlito syrichta]
MSQRLGPQLPQSVTEDAYCEIHLAPSQLFCDTDQTTLCGKCFQSQEHKHHLVYEIQEAAENYRKLFQEILNTLRVKLEAAKSILAGEQERMVMIQEEEQKLKEMIESEYRINLLLLNEENQLNFQKTQRGTFDLNMREASLNRFATELEENSQESLQRLNHLGTETMRKLKESAVRVSEHICSLQQAATELEKKCEDSASVLLQCEEATPSMNARCSLERSESLLLQDLEPTHTTDLSSCRVRGMSRMLTFYQKHITLDPNTAHSCLVLSEDLRSVVCGNSQGNMPGSPGRFDFSATVLGVERFTSGRHYWEVNVGKAAQWQLGVLRDAADRKGSAPKASGDRFLLTGSLMGTDYTLWAFPPLKRVFLRKHLQNIGVFLDYEYGQISFYDVVERTLIYSFSCLTFQGVLRPIFSLCIPNGDISSGSLTVSPHRVSSCNVTVSP